MNSFKLIKSSYTSLSHTQIEALLEDNTGVQFTFYFVPNSNDISPAYAFLQELYDNNSLQPYYSLEAELVSKQKIIRDQRDSLLDETDKYMTMDYPISDSKRDEIKIYRQSLRDVPQQEGFPDNIIWPEKPVIN